LARIGMAELAAGTTDKASMGERFGASVPLDKGCAGFPANPGQRRPSEISQCRRMRTKN
jgi:hypothetical protein